MTFGGDRAVDPLAQLPLPTQVTFDHEGRDERPACVGGTMVLTPSMI
jgi:hypothetical protein